MTDNQQNRDDNQDGKNQEDDHEDIEDEYEELKMLMNAAIRDSKLNYFQLSRFIIL